MKDKIIALVGRPNVGKSTLFNRLSIRKKAVVHNKPGVTRDRKYADAQLGPYYFKIIDTPGLEEAKEGELEYRMMHQTLAAINEANLTFLIIDGLQGVTPLDKFLANILRKNNRSYKVVINKCEKTIVLSKEYYELGDNAPIQISAEHNIGMMNFYECINDSTNDSFKSPKLLNSIDIAIVGRPNAGKSTLVNAILGNERLLTGSEAGLTRESIEIEWKYKDYNLKLVDTAGLRKKSSINQQLEKLSASDAIETINFANIVILMLDATALLESQDLAIANHIIKEGRGVLIAINKWDLITEKKKFIEEVEYILSKDLSYIKNVSVVYISATNKQNINLLLDQCIKVYKIWNTKISTSKLNDWLNHITQNHPLPLNKGGRRVRIKYITQIKTRPPTFQLFTNDPDKISDSYIKYLINSLREHFNIPGIPIRFYFKKSKNPYIDNK